ncbi:MAG: GNAT family N-acetyltransferase [Clostridia bacterium]
MQIRDYADSDEQGWLRCRVVSFMDTSYFNDVKTKKELFNHPSICLIAEENQTIIGLIDIELDSDDLTYTSNERGAIIWNMAVLPEYRKHRVGRQLWEHAKERLLEQGIHYCELWTQEDVAANQFYKSIGFTLENSQTWIRCYTKGKKCMPLLNKAELGEIYGPEELIFDAPFNRKEELTKQCYRIDEVRLYTMKL